MEPITIDYRLLLSITVGLFALVGFFRGWLKEGMTTIFVVLLTGMLSRPEMAKVIIDYINKFIERFWRVVGTGEPPIHLDPENTQVYVGILILLVILSYMSGKITFGGEGLTAASRLMGGILGAFNGYMILSLAREYVLGFFLHPAEVTTQEIPEELSIQIKDLPQQSLVLQNYFVMLVMVGGLIIFLLILATSLRLQSPIARKKQ